MNRILFVMIVLSLGAGSVTAFAQDVSTDFVADPFAAVEHITLDNGMQVFLSQSMQAVETAVRLEVQVGWEAEDAKNWGVSHLLEHVLFRDKQLKDEMTYLQLIREAGGQANGTTENRRTSYFGSIPHAKGIWLLDNFAKMLLNPSINDEYVQKEKGTVELERGRPNPIALALGFNPVDYIYPKYLKNPDFWESEFGISSREPFTLSEEQLSTRRLTAEQVKKHFDEYYYPANMRLFVAGRFNREAVMAKIKEKWAKFPARVGKVLPELKTPKPRLDPYKRIVITDGNPYIYIGTKLWEVTNVENEILASYMDFLSHRMMKEVRNLKGQTYSAWPTTFTTHGIGYSYIQFQTPEEHVQDNIKFVRDYFKKEAEVGGFTEAQVQEAKNLYLADFLRKGKEAQDMMDLATHYREILENYGSFQSPYEALSSVSVEDYNQALKKHYSQNKRYEYFYVPNFLFHYDGYIFYFLLAIATFTFSRRLLTRNFQNDKVQWVRKVKYPPLKILEALTLVAGWYVYAHLTWGLEKIFKSNVLQSHVLTAEYLYGMCICVSFLIVMQGVISLLPRKLMIVDDKLVIKSVTYFSRHIPMSEITLVQVLKPFSVETFRLYKKKKFNFRTNYFNPLFWQPGIVIHLRDGRAYFFSVRDAYKVKAEIEGFLDFGVEDHRQLSLAV